MIRTIKGNTIVYLENDYQVREFSKSRMRFQGSELPLREELIPPCCVYFLSTNIPESWAHLTKPIIAKDHGALQKYFRAPSATILEFKDIYLPDLSQEKFEATVEEICKKQPCSACILSKCCNNTDESKRKEYLKLAHEICADWLKNQQDQDKTDTSVNLFNKSIGEPKAEDMKKIQESIGFSSMTHHATKQLNEKSSKVAAEPPKPQYSDELYKNAFECGEGKGMRDAWSLVRKLQLPSDQGGLTQKQIKEIFGMNKTQVYESMSVEDAIARLCDWEREAAAIHQNDVVKFGNKTGVVCTANVDNNKYLMWVFSINDYVFAQKEDLTKTGRTLDMRQVLQGSPFGAELFDKGVDVPEQEK